MKQTANPQKLFFMNSLKPFLVVAVMLLQLLFASETVFAQNKTVKGRVTNDTGEPVAKASVQVKGTNTGTTTNDDGEFQISVPVNGVIIISAINLIEQEIKVGARTSIDVKLAAADKSLENIVVIGYGTQRKRDVTGSTISIKSETLNEIKAPGGIFQVQRHLLQEFSNIIQKVQQVFNLIIC